MGKVYQSIVNYLPDKTTGVFVEIGSERWEGSTIWLDRLAGQCMTKLISVDIKSDAQQRYSNQLTNTEFVVAPGSTWAKQFASTPTDIAVLYLDNFDYIWDINLILNDTDIKQRRFYEEELGIPMANQTCQVEHMKQMIAIFPYLTDDAVVVFDDTHTLNDCWVGKCGANVIWLLAQGFEIVRQEFFEYGVIMKRHKIK